MIGKGNKKWTCISTHPFFVTPTGFKPVTFWSVVRCSIQLSYGAILQSICQIYMSCDSDRIQTCNLLIRSQMLYSVELRSHTPNFAKLSFVIPTGFKPVTFWSVVRCSIQLSYGTMSFSFNGCKGSYFFRISKPFLSFFYKKSIGFFCRCFMWLIMSD